VYTATITADSGQSTSFITFVALTRVISWSAPTVAGVYTANITGQIANAVGTYTATTTFVITVYSCSTSIDTITITPSTTTSVTMTLSDATSGSQTID
jgi:hypothetical protein